MKPGLHEALYIRDYYNGIDQIQNPKLYKTDELIYDYRTDKFYEILELKIDGAVVIECSSDDTFFFPDFMLSRCYPVGNKIHV